VAVLGVNLTGFFHTQLTVAEMEKRRSGHIVQITTSLIEHANSHVPSALASLTKGGLSAATISLAIERPRPSPGWRRCSTGRSSNATSCLSGRTGVGKSMLAQNIAHQAVIDGHTVLFTSAGQLLGDLCALDSDSTLQRRLRHYARPQPLVIDEVGYLSYSNRHADMLFQLVSRRYQNKSTLITTNRAFGEWNEVFPNAACVAVDCGN